jgi:hypothetical protein
MCFIEELERCYCLNPEDFELEFFRVCEICGQKRCGNCINFVDMKSDLRLTCPQCLNHLQVFNPFLRRQES